MKNKRKGISLIVLVITILVMIILATAVILTITRTNTINKARKANFLDIYAGLKESLSVKVANMILDDSNVTTAQIDAIEIQELNPSLDATTASKFDVQNRKIVLTANATEEEMKWVTDGVTESTEKTNEANISYGQSTPNNTKSIWVKINKPEHTYVSIDNIPTTLDEGVLCIVIAKGDSFELIDDFLKCNIIGVYLGDSNNVPQPQQISRYINGSWIEGENIIFAATTLLYLNCNSLNVTDQSSKKRSTYNVSGISLDSSGKFGNAYAFTEGHIHYVSNDLKFGNNPFTIEMWVKRPGTPNSGLAKTGSFLSMGYNGSNSSYGQGADLSYSPTGIYWSYGGGQAFMNVKMEIDTTIWHHIAVVGNSTYIELFFDGQSVSKVNCNYNMMSDGNLNFGSNFAGQFSYFQKFDGSIDEIAVYSYARYTSNFQPQLVEYN